MARPGVASRSARGSEQQIQAKLEKKYQDYCTIRDVLEKMEVGEAVLGPRVEEPKRRCGRAGPWRIKTLAELEEEINVMTRLRAAVLFGWNSRENISQMQLQQHAPPAATRLHHPSLSTPPPSADTTPISALETDDAAAAASLQMLQQLGVYRQYHDQQEQHGYPLGDAETQPDGAGPALATPTDLDELGKDPTHYQQQQQHGGVFQLCEGLQMPIDDVHQTTTDTSSSGHVEQALPTSMACQQPDMGVLAGVGDEVQQHAGDGLNQELWDVSNSQEQEQAGHFSEEDLLGWDQMSGWEEMLFNTDWSIAPDEGLKDSSEAM